MLSRTETERLRNEVDVFKDLVAKAFNRLLADCDFAAKNLSGSKDAMEDLRGYLTDIQSDFVSTATRSERQTLDDAESYWSATDESADRAWHLGRVL